VNAHLVAAATKLFRDTLAWTSTDPYVLVGGVSEYELDFPAQSYAITVRDVWIGSQRLRPLTLLELSTDQWANQASSLPAAYNASVDRGSIKLYPVPNEAQSMTIRASFAPVIGATELPDFIGQRHMDVVCAGTKASLMLMAAQAWGNPQMAGVFQQQFTDGLNEIKVAEIHDRVPGTVMVQPRRFGF